MIVVQTNCMYVTFTHLIGAELGSVHWCRVLDHHQCVVSKALTVEVLRVGEIDKRTTQNCS